MIETLSIRIDTATKKKMDALAVRARGSKSFLAAEAISAYVESEAWQLGEIEASRRSIWHLIALREHIERDSDETAARVAKPIVQAIDLLESRPAMGRPGRVAGTRELVVPDTTYIVPYRVRGEVIELIAVFHGRRQWPSPARTGRAEV